ncbi:MAG TPA: LysE family transporter [Spirochaetota bacterium]|nr:LysE family transporter [Spirochaetota bacterium]
MNDFNASSAFIVQSLIVTIPGLLTPGPVMAITIEKGTGSPHAGAFITMGHAVVEIPLVILLFMGLGRFSTLPLVRFTLALTGGFYLLYMAWKTFSSRNTSMPRTGMATGSAFTAGILMTLANPFFMFWWATIGSALIVRSLELGIVVSVLFYSLHITTNFIWLYFISYMSNKGHAFFGARYRYIVSILSGAILLFFGGYFLLTAFKINLL